MSHEPIAEEILTEHLKIKLTKGQLATAFHALWTECVGTKAYNKKAWNDVREQLNEAGFII